MWLFNKQQKNNRRYWLIGEARKASCFFLHAYLDLNSDTRVCISVIGVEGNYWGAGGWQEETGVRGVKDIKKGEYEYELSTMTCVYERIIKNYFVVNYKLMIIKTIE